MKNEHTAWFGSDHPAHDEHCITCGAKPGARCTTAGTFGGRHPLTGLHAARIAATKAVRL